jgi:hypothetical protein
MAKTKLSEYSATAASNTDINSINIDEGMSPSNVNNAIRELMAQLKNMEDGTDAVTAIKSGNIQITSNTISSTDTNGNIALTPNGTGSVVIDGINYPQADGTADYFLKTNGAGQLSFAQVDTASIAADAIDGTKIADDSIDSEHYVDGSIDTAHIADTAVTDAKISGMSSSKLSGALPAIDGSALTGISAGLPGPRAEVFTSSGTFTVPTGVTAVKVTVVGGGGAGGYGLYSSQAAVASGGGGGGVAIKYITGLTSGDTVSVTVGAGATGTTTSGQRPAGGTSSFGAYCSATGGDGGYYSDTPSGNVRSGGNGGAGSGGDFNITGGRGGFTFYSSNFGYPMSGGGGGPMGQEAISPTHIIEGANLGYLGMSRWNGRPQSGYFGGICGGPKYYNGVGNSGTGYGCGGGGGAVISSGSNAGGDGYQGMVLVEY